MGKGRAQAQAVAQRTAAITNQDSFQLVKCLIRVSVYHVCWMRGLFPEGSLTGHDLAQLDKLHVKMLEPNEEDDEATTLKNWVEQGVMDAVSKGYLKNMYFGIATDATATNLLEEYIYSFKYGEDGVQFDLKATNNNQDAGTYKSKGKERPGVDDVRYQVVRLMRMLVQLCQTLDKVPDERYLFIKLTYHDHAPQEYEPPFFHGVKEEGMGFFDRRPFSMDVGTMDTHHHKVTVRVKSVLDSCDDNEGPADQAMEEMMASQQITLDGEGVKARPAGGDEEMAEAEAATPPSQDPASQEDTAVGAAAADLSPGGPRLRTEEALALLTATEDPNLLLDADGQCPPNPQGPTDSHDLTCATDDMEADGGGESAGGSGGGSGQAVYESVRSFCLLRPVVGYVDLMANFYELSEDQLGKVLDGLLREGLIEAGPQKDTYTVLHPTAAAAPHFQPHTTSEGIMAEAGAGSGGSVAAAAAMHNSQQLAEDQMLTNQMSGLSVGAAAAAAAKNARGVAGAAANASVYGAAMLAGSLMTGQPGAPPGAPTAATPQANTAAEGEPSVQLQQEQQGLWLDASQQSFQGPKAADGADGAAAAGKGGKSRLRKASYVNSPIYQHRGKRGPGSSLHQQMQQLEEQQEEEEDALLPEGGGADAAGAAEHTNRDQQLRKQQKAAAAAAEAAAPMQAPPNRKKLTVRKPKKPAAATAATGGTPTRGGGRMAAMRS